MERKKSRLEKWIERYIDAKFMGWVKATRSSYYRFNNRILRISDHVALTSDGDISIILDSHDEEHFILHAVKSGEISVLTYNEVKTLIRAIRLLPSTMHICNAMLPSSVDPRLGENDKKVVIKDAIERSALEKLVLGIPIGRFKTGQQQAIHAMVNKINKTM